MIWSLETLIFTYGMTERATSQQTNLSAAFMITSEEELKILNALKK